LKAAADFSLSLQLLAVLPPASTFLPSGEFVMSSVRVDQPPGTSFPPALGSILRI
jgi:hypothetical protein